MSLPQYVLVVNLGSGPTKVGQAETSEDILRQVEHWAIHVPDAEVGVYQKMAEHGYVPKGLENSLHRLDAILAQVRSLLNKE